MSSSVPLFDANCAMGPIPWGEPGLPDATAVVRHLDRFGLDRALVSHTSAWRHDPMAGNQEIVEQARGDSRIRPCWVALPGTCGEVPPAAEYARQAQSLGVAALRAYPDEHGFDVDGADFRPYLEAAAEAVLPVLLPADGTPWAAVDAVLERHPSLIVILTDVGYRTLRRTAGLLGRYDGLRIELSGLTSHEGFEWICEQFGADRVVFGTGAPLRDAGEAVTRLFWSGLTDRDVQRVAADNLRVLLGERWDA
jgi:predicted TIM-barrel fold metal-dependent hydrolase